MRTREGEQEYDRYKQAGGLDDGCRLCDAPALKEFEHWRIVDNKFPYDMIASTHHMIVPRTHSTVHDIPRDAWAEYNALRNGLLDQEYDFLAEATTHRKSIPQHHHVHLLVLKKRSDTTQS